MGPRVAYELRSDHEDFAGGQIALADGETFDVGEELKKGGGKIVLDLDPGERKDPEAQEKENARARAHRGIAVALDAYPALKSSAADTAKKDGDS